MSSRNIPVRGGKIAIGRFRAKTEFVDRGSRQHDCCLNPADSQRRFYFLPGERWSRISGFIEPSALSQKSLKTFILDEIGQDVWLRLHGWY